MAVSNARAKRIRARVANLKRHYAAVEGSPRPVVELEIDDEGRLRIWCRFGFKTSPLMREKPLHEMTAKELDKNLSTTNLDLVVEEAVNQFLLAASQWLRVAYRTCPLCGSEADVSGIQTVNGTPNVVCPNCNWRPAKLQPQVEVAHG